MSLQPKGQCHGWCESADKTLLSGYTKSLYCNCVYDWGRIGLDDNTPPPIPEEALTCGLCPEPCGNDWCCMKDKK